MRLCRFKKSPEESMSKDHQSAFKRSKGLTEMKQGVWAFGEVEDAKVLEGLAKLLHNRVHEKIPVFWNFQFTHCHPVNVQTNPAEAESSANSAPAGRGSAEWCRGIFEGSSLPSLSSLPVPPSNRGKGAGGGPKSTGRPMPFSRVS